MAGVCVLFTSLCGHSVGAVTKVTLLIIPSEGAEFQVVK